MGHVAIPAETYRRLLELLVRLPYGQVAAVVQELQAQARDVTLNPEPPQPVEEKEDELNRAAGGG